MGKSDIGLIGLAVMGRNLVMNMSDHGFHVSVYNRTHIQSRCVRERRSTGSFGGWDFTPLKNWCPA